jgi:hypothetical protein
MLYCCNMAGVPPIARAARAEPQHPELSLLRWSAWQRLFGVAVVLAAMWLAILLTIG